MTKRSEALRMLGYVRVSTGKQSASGLSLDAQDRLIRDECQRNGWECVEIFTDPAISGKSLDRPELQRALTEIAQGRADGLVATKLDRLSRSLVDAVNLMRWFDRAKAVLVVSDLGLNTANASGRLVASVMAALGEWEREAISDRTAIALAEKRRQGQRISRPAVVDELPEVAQRIQKERAKGKTWQAIADGLNKSGVKTVRGGAEWRVSSVQSAAGYRRPPPAPKDSVLPAIPKRKARTAR